MARKAGEQLVNVSFPFKGLDESMALSQQPKLTTPSCLNVRAVDRRTGRLSGGSRSGISKYLSSQISGDDSIQEITHVTLAHFDPTSGIGQVAFGRQTGAGTGSYTLLSDGVAFATGGTAAYQHHGSIWDEDGYVYVAYSDPSAPRVLKIQSATKAGVVRWTITVGTFYDATNDFVRGLVAEGGVLYVFLQDTDNFTAQNRVGLLRYNTSDGTAYGTNPWKEWSDTTVVGFLPTNNGMAYTQGVVGVGLNVSGSLVIRAVNITTGSATDIATLNDTGDSQCQNLVADSLGNFFILHFTAGSGSVSLEKIGMDGTSHWRFSQADATLTVITGIAYDAKNIRLAAVGADVRATGHSFATLSVSTGSVVASSDMGGETSWYSVEADGDGGFILARGSGTNDFSGVGEDLVEDWAIDNTTLYQYYWISANNREGVVSVAPGLNLRNIRGVVVAGGTVKRFSNEDTLASVTSGSLALSPLAPVVMSAEYAGDVYFADGVNMKFYDSSADAVSSITASAGSLPVDAYGNRPRLVVLWRGRLVWSGIIRDPHNWFMSAVDAPTDYDYSPAEILETIAVAGNNSAAGKVGDIINCLIAYSDDMLIFGCDHTIWQMTGDPMAGGRIDLISDSIGMAWGKPYCRDASGMLYFFGSRGGVYSMAPGQPPKHISNAIEHRLEAVNTGTNLIRMAWDERGKNLHVFITPLDSTEAATHYTFEAGSGAWQPDSFVDAAFNPKCVHVFDGDDPADRVVLIGSWDGYVRQIDENALSDDGEAIDSHVDLSVSGKTLEAFMLKELQAVLTDDSDDVSYSVRVGSYAEKSFNAEAVVSGTWSGGRNRSTQIRRDAATAYIRIAQNQAGKSWALEQLVAKLAPLSAMRQRWVK